MKSFIGKELHKNILFRNTIIILKNCIKKKEISLKVKLSYALAAFYSPNLPKLGEVPCSQSTHLQICRIQRCVLQVYKYIQSSTDTTI